MARSKRSFRASITGIEMAKKALDRTGWTQGYLADSVNCSRPKVIDFLSGKPCDKTLFKSLCSKLDLESEEIVDWDLEEIANKSIDSSNRETCDSNEEIKNDEKSRLVQ